MLNGKILKAFPLSQGDRHEVKTNLETGGKIVTICRLYDFFFYLENSRKSPEKGLHKKIQ